LLLLLLLLLLVHGGAGDAVITAWWSQLALVANEDYVSLVEDTSRENNGCHSAYNVLCTVDAERYRC